MADIFYKFSNPIELAADATQHHQLQIRIDNVKINHKTNSVTIDATYIKPVQKESND